MTPFLPCRFHPKDEILYHASGSVCGLCGVTISRREPPKPRETEADFAPFNDPSDVTDADVADLGRGGP